MTRKNLSIFACAAVAALALSACGKKEELPAPAAAPASAPAAVAVNTEEKVLNI